MKTKESTSFADEVYELYQGNKVELNKRESDIVSRYYGFGKNRRHTLAEIGTVYGLTRERIRQIKFSALKKIGAL